MRFVLVNGRTPCQKCVCVLCGEPIGASYLREVGTQLTYCGHDCYADHCASAALLLENHAMSIGLGPDSSDAAKHWAAAAE
jgi:hypothetical protein